MMAQDNNPRKSKGFDWYGRDGERSREIAFVATSGGALVCTPEDLMELLFIAAQFHGGEWDSFIESIAHETFPRSRDGAQSIQKFIKRAQAQAVGRKGGKP